MNIEKSIYKDSDSVFIYDAPCIFNGGGDSEEDVFCVSKSWLEWKDCEDLKTNAIITHEGEEREICNEAHIIFGWQFMCGWINGYGKNDGYCGHVYYLTENGMDIKMRFFFFYI
jgi:hypothetical protein